MIAMFIDLYQGRGRTRRRKPPVKYRVQAQRAELHLDLTDDAVRELAMHSIQTQPANSATTRIGATP